MKCCLSASVLLYVWFASLLAYAQTDEIQIYTGRINEPREFSLAVHNNYTPVGRGTADFPGGIVPAHSLNGVAESALGITDWFELGLYLPLYSVTSDGRATFNGSKLRLLFVAPHASERKFYYGCNFEFSYNRPQWDTSHYSGEIRPIIGTRWKEFDFIFNPIVDYTFDDLGGIVFAPAARIDYNFSPVWAAAVEQYSDFGAFRSLKPASSQARSTFAVVDYTADPLNVEFGIGRGFTLASDPLVLKLIVAWSFFRG